MWRLILKRKNGEGKTLKFDDVGDAQQTLHETRKKGRYDGFIHRARA